MLARALKMLLGVVTFVLGLAMLVGPGPGVVVALLGAGLVLSQFEVGRRLIRRLRWRMRNRWGSDRVRALERRLPREIVGHEDTTALERDVLEQEVERRRRAGRRRSSR